MFFAILVLLSFGIKTGFVTTVLAGNSAIKVCKLLWELVSKSQKK